ncbi:hypothetical protein C6P40_001953, partial [Pichia californica]
MKFAQSLEDHLVPEWRTQYLDYKAGKKKLKKLSRKPSVISSIKSTPLQLEKSPALSLSKRYTDNPQLSTPNTIKNSHTSTSLFALNEENENDNENENKNENENENEDNHDHQSGHKYNDSNGLDMISSLKDNHFEDQITLESNSSSFALPAAALNVNDTVYGANVSPFPRESTRINPIIDSKNGIHDKTPLLNSKQPTLNVTFGKLKHSVPSTPSSDFNPQRRRSSISALFDTFKRSPSISGKSQATELEDLAAYARQKFLGWVDGELDKVNSFYSEKEDACVQRFLILQDQILQLELQKQESKKKWLNTKRALKGQQNNHSHQHLHHHNASSDNIDADGDIEDDFDDDDDDEEEDDEDNENGYDEYMHSGILTGYNTVNYGVFNSAQRNFKLLSFWTRRKLRIINKFDMPSLPTFEWLKEDGKVEKQYYEDGYYSDGSDGSDEENDNNNNNNN